MSADDKHSVNIPIEILRAVVEIAKSGSYTKAAEILGTTQPNVTLQIRKFQKFVGGQVFERTARGFRLTAKGEIILPLVRELLETNNMLISLGTSSDVSRPLRLGISDVFAPTLMAKDVTLNGLFIQCGTVQEIGISLQQGDIDIACLVNFSPEYGSIVDSWDEELVWVRSRTFVCSPDKPIPLVCCSACSLESGIDALNNTGASFRIVLESRDMRTCLLAVEGGVGLMAVPRRIVSEPIVVAQEYYLPQLPTLRAAICVRDGLPVEPVSGMIRVLKEAIGLPGS